jgi:hypothetical protein
MGRYFHGTTDKLVDKITEHGLYDWMYRQPCWLSDNYRDASFFATLRVESQDVSGADFPGALGGRPVVVEVDVPEDLVAKLGPLGSYAKKPLPPDRIISITPVSRSQEARRKRALYYPGFMGVMETAEFIQKASEEDIAYFEQLLDEGRMDEAWRLVESYLGLEHHDITEPGMLQPSYRPANLITCYSGTDSDPTLFGIREGAFLTTNKRECRWIVAELRVPENLLEEQDNDSPLVTHYEALAHIDPRWVRAANYPDVQESFGRSFVSLPIWDVFSQTKDAREREYLSQALKRGAIAPLSIFLGRATSGRVSQNDLYEVLSNARVIVDDQRVTVVRKADSEIDKNMTLSIGDIVRDINTGIEGEIIAVSKMHHEADIDIVVEWEEPINGQKIFEVHPNEIEFVRKKTEGETLKDIDWRYYEESVEENQAI